MKNIFTLILSITLMSSGVSFAQNNAGKADDEARIAITAQVSDEEMPAAAKKNLTNKMKQIATKNGLAGDGENPFFIMDASVDVLSKEITPTAPPMHALSLQINFFIKGADGTIFSETSYTTKGVGKNETKAYLQGMKNISTSRGQFKAFVERGKEKIVEYYNSNCDMVISQSKAMHKQGRNDAATVILQSVPPVCKECYDMCMEVMAEIAPSDEFIAAETAAIVGGSKAVEESADSTSNSSETPGTVGLGMTVDFSQMGGYPGAKTTYKKELKYTPFELPMDQFGNFSFSDKTVVVNGKVIRYQFETSGDNNPDYLLKLAQPVYQALGYEIVFAKTNSELGGSRTIHYHYGNSKLGGKYNVGWGNESGSYLLVKSIQGEKTVYIAIYFVEFNDKTVISQDYIEVE